MIKLMRAAVGATFAAAAVASLAGCPGAQLPGGIGTSAMPSGAAGATCDQAAPAGTPSTGSSAHGAYNAQRLPAGWDVQLKSEQEVTDAIAKIEAGNPTTWACFQGFYPGTTSIYKTKKK